MAEEKHDPGATPPDPRPSASSTTWADGIWLAAATFLGAGRLPIAPGTWGSLFTALLYWALLTQVSTPVLIAITVVVTIVGVISSTHAERILNKHDPGEVVIDEVAGQLVAVLVLHAWRRSTPLLILVSFLAFRVFDVLKPFPCYQLQRLPRGWGVVADDLFAGLYAAAVAAGAALILR
jgi:phosphatidylglycerophosphatase A